MAKPGSVIGWLLAEDDRAKLLEQFPPRYEKVVAHHVTLNTEAENDPLPPQVDARVVGRTDDGDSLEGLVVEVDGTTDRPDGSTYHITWSLGPGRRARETNDVLRQQGWKRLERAIPIKLEPGRF